MAERKSVHLEKQQLDTIEDMVERGIADNQSEAHRMLLNAGRGEYGYETDGYADTLLKNGVENAAWLLTVAGMVGLTFTFAYPIPARVPSFAVLAFGVFLFPVAQALSDVEPKVSNRLKRLFGGEKA